MFAMCFFLGVVIICWREVRDAVEPLWLAKHATWSGPVPDPPSRFMCRYTAELVALIDCRWGVVSGEVDGCGTHVWNERDGWILDLTADQFGHTPVHLGRRSARYHCTGWADEATAVPFRRTACEWYRTILRSCSAVASVRGDLG